MDDEDVGAAEPTPSPGWWPAPLASPPTPPPEATQPYVVAGLSEWSQSGQPIGSDVPPRRRRVSLWLVLLLLLCGGAVVGAAAYSSHATQRRREARASVASSMARLDHQQRDTRVSASGLAQTAGQARTQLGSMTRPEAALQGIADAAHQLGTTQRELVHDGETLVSPSVYNAIADEANRELDQWRRMLAALGKLDQQLVT